MENGFIRSGIHTLTGRGVQRRSGGGGWQQTRQWVNKSPTSKFSPLGLVSCVTIIYFTPRGEGEQRRGLIPLGFFSFPRGHLPQTSGFRSVKQILVASFATRIRACILSDHNLFYTPRGGRATAGTNALGAFFFLLVLL